MFSLLGPGPLLGSQKRREEGKGKERREIASGKALRGRQG